MISLTILYGDSLHTLCVNDSVHFFTTSAQISTSTASINSLHFWISWLIMHARYFLLSLFHILMVVCVKAYLVTNIDAPIQHFFPCVIVLVQQHYKQQEIFYHLKLWVPRSSLSLECFKRFGFSDILHLKAYFLFCLHFTAQCSCFVASSF